MTTPIARYSMKRYRVIYSTTPSGGYSEFSASSDANALAIAKLSAFDARIVSLGEVTYPHGFRPVPHG
jgi:hypothetical protein